MRGSFIKKLHYAFLISLTLLIVSSIASFITIQKSNTQAELIHHTKTVQEQLENLISIIKDAQSSARGYIVTQNPETLKYFHDSNRNAMEAFSRLRQLTSDNPPQQETLKTLYVKITERYQILGKLIEMGTGNPQFAKTAVMEGSAIMDNIRTLVNTMKRREEILLSERTGSWNILSASTHWLILIVAIFSVISSYYFCTNLKTTYFKFVKVQKQLHTKTLETDQRIAIIQQLTDKIALGNYHIRLQEKESDVLGTLAGNLNRMATSLEYSFNALKNLMEKKDDFIGIAAHELKTPLTSLKAYLQIIGKIKLSSEEGLKIHPLIEKANLQVNRLSDIIKDLLDVTRINEGQLNLELSKFSIRELIIEASEELFSSTKTHELVLKSDSDAYTEADRFRIKQVLMKLMSNSMKYSPGSNKIVAEIIPEEDCVKVQIKDFGIGIPDKNLPYIFERYFRVEQTSQNFRGMGLGLFISKGIIERHGGKMGVHSTGAGSTFWFSIPLLQNS